MTSTLVQGVGRRPGEPVRPLRAFAASPALFILLLGALALRLTIAYVLFPSSGFETDLAAYASWALTLGEHGPGGFYANAGFADYPPAYLYLLWPIGLLVGQGADAAARASEMVKVPPILLDLAVGYVIYRLVLGWAWPGRRAETVALAGAALYLFNPVSFYDSALWGQSDAAGGLLLLLGAAALIRGNSEGAAAMAATAAVVKPQFGVVLLPIVVFVLVKRHLLRPGSGPHQPPWAPRALAGWLTREQGWPRLVTALAAAWAAFFVLALPFEMGPLEYMERMFGTASGYAYLTVNAFNAWAFFGTGGTAPLAESWRWSDDTLPLLGPIPGLAIGTALLVAGFLWGSLRAALRDDRWTLLLALTFLTIAFFVLPTRVHERYIVPAVALLPILAVVSRRWAVALLMLSVGAFINLHAVLTLPLYGTDDVTSLPLGEAFRSPLLMLVSAATQTAVGAWAAWQLRPGLRTSPDAFEAEARAALGPRHGIESAGAADRTREPWARGPSALDWLVLRLSRPAIRADRSAELVGERGGRLGRVDALVVVALVLAAVVIRGYRLEQPVGMHFDEVYHARTATEFLQHWEYGQPHAIYEFTHPHLAKYAMAWGIRLAGGNEVTASTDLGVPVVGAAIERRWSAPESPGLRKGDRLYIGSGDALHVYDLASRDLLHEIPVAATALAIDEDSHDLYVADPGGGILRLDTEALDAHREGRAVEARPTAFSDGPGVPVRRLLVTDTSLVAISAGSISTFDTETGLPLSERFAFSATDAVALPWVERVVVDTRLVTDRGSLARALASKSWDVDSDSAGASVDEVRPAARERESEERRLRQLFGVEGFVVVDAYLDEAALTRIRAAIDEGDLPGVSVESAPLLAVADHAGVSILDAWTLDLIDEIPTADPVTALTVVEQGLAEPTLYAASGSGLEIVPLLEEGPGLPDSLTMPGEVRGLVWNEPANMVHALGEAPRGGSTVYVVEPHGNAVFLDVPLSLEPAFLLADTQPERPAEDRGELIAVAADGRLDRVSIDGNAFGWRLPGMLLGALMAALLYLLARVLFARRSVAMVAAVLVIAEGMFFANSRIGMNDVYVTTFIVAAALLFTPLYLAPRRSWASIALLLGAGLALGLALASKWVGLFAMGGLLLLVLLRSGLGRVLALLAMIGLTSVLGAMAAQPSAVQEAGRNWLFVALMLLLTGLLAAAMVRRPLAVSRGEVRLAVLGALAMGAILLAAGMALPPAQTDAGGTFAGVAADGRLLVAGTTAMLAGLGIGLAAWLAGRVGRGPFGRSVARVDEATSGWLRPGWLTGLPWLFTLASLGLLPLGVYILAYAPWVELGNQWGLPVIGSLPFMPAGAEGGRTLADLTRSIYEYHDNLRAEHAASSPWWAWPLDLKPVWFFSERYADGTTGLIYDTGNLVIFWLGIAGLAFTSWAAWYRRSLSLTVVIILWAALWLPWARIDRATFQYHVHASLPFMILALAWFLAELWHGPSIRTWFLARAAGTLAILAVPLLWLLRTPLCILAGTAVARPDGLACAAQVTRTAQLSEAGAAALVVAVVGAAAAALLGWRAARRPSTVPARRGPGATPLVWLVVIALMTLGGVVAALSLLDSGSAVPVTLSADVLALLGLAVLAIPAWLVLRARDPRRFVLGVLGIAVLWLIIWYPNISGLPLPADLAHIYQGLLPTWNWDFQFAVDTDPAGGGDSGPATLVMSAITVAFVVGVAVAAWLWGRTTHQPDEVLPPVAALPGAPRS